MNLDELPIESEPSLTEPETLRGIINTLIVKINELESRISQLENQ